MSFPQSLNIIYNQDTKLNTQSTEFSPELALDSNSNGYITFRSFINNTNMAVLAKIDNNLSFIWKLDISINEIDTSYSVTSSDVVVDNSDNIILVYYRFKEITTTNYIYQNVIYKFDKDGNIIYSNILTSQGLRIDPLTGVGITPRLTIDNQNNIIITSFYSTATNSFQVQAIKLDRSLNLLWTTYNIRNSLNTTLSEQNPTVITDSNNNIYIAYQTNGNIGTNEGGYDIVIAKLNGNGELQWTKQETAFNTAGSDTNCSISIDSNDNVFVAYRVSDDVDNLNSQTEYSGGNADIAILKIDTNGNYNIFQDPSWNTIDYEDSPSIAVDNSDNIIVSYHTTGSLNGYINKGNSDIVVIKLDNSCNLLWTLQDPCFNTIGNDYYVDIDINDKNSIFGVFHTNNSIDQSNNVNQGGFDIVMFKIYNPNDDITIDPNAPIIEEPPIIITTKSDNLYLYKKKYDRINNTNHLLNQMFVNISKRVYLKNIDNTFINKQNSAGVKNKYASNIIKKKKIIALGKNYNSYTK